MAAHPPPLVSYGTTAPRRAIARTSAWPSLPIERWRDTYQTLHLYAQIVGKIQLALTPKVNQWWNAGFRLGPRGFRTSPLQSGERTFEIAFDFVRHEVEISDGEGRIRALALVPALSVAEFHRALHHQLVGLGIEARINPVPCEIPMTTPFPQDNAHRTYLAEDASALFLALSRIAPVFEAFRARFRGKCSPVQLYWGSFDLSVTRYNGWRLPAPAGPPLSRDRYDEECISLGFWPGDAWSPLRDDRRSIDATFYSHAVPEPSGIAHHPVGPPAAYYDGERREFMLPYEKVRSAADPVHAILQFAESTYDAAASLAGWNREALAYP